MATKLTLDEMLELGRKVTTWKRIPTRYEASGAMDTTDEYTVSHRWCIESYMGLLEGIKLTVLHRETTYGDYEASPHEYTIKAKFGEICMGSYEKIGGGNIQKFYDRVARSTARRLAEIARNQRQIKKAKSEKKLGSALKRARDLLK